MNTKLLSAAILALAAGSAAAQPTAITYQGELKSGGQLANGLHDMQFRLFDSSSGGNQVGSTICMDGILVTSGRFIARMDFGHQYATASSLYLEIDVRADIGQDCSNTSGFATLSTRQRLTAAPLAVHAKSATALHAPDGAPLNAVSVSNSGLVGINTTTPAKALTVAGDMEVGTSGADYRHLRMGGGNSSGFLYGSFPALADGIHLGYNYYADAAGAHRVTNTGGATSRISVGYGTVALATGGINAQPTNRLVVEQTGNVRIGPNTQYYVPAGEENLRIVRGVFTAAGGIITGSGFTVTRTAVGRYTVNPTTSFTSPPTVVATAHGLSNFTVTLDGAVGNWWKFVCTNQFGNPVDVPVHFIAIGTR